MPSDTANQKETELKEIAEFLDAQEWTFAKTYAKTTPHEYIIVKSDDPRRPMLKRVFEMLKKYGKTEKFFGIEWLYLYPGDGYKYFAAPDGSGWDDETICLNRANANVSY